MRRKIITLILIIGLWQGFALSIDKAVILPLPLVVFNQMFNLATSQSFYIAIGATLSRVALSFFLALIVGTILGVFSGLFKVLMEYFSSNFLILTNYPSNCLYFNFYWYGLKVDCIDHHCFIDDFASIL